MNFLGIILAKNVVYSPGLNGINTALYSTLESAKNAIATFVAGNKGTFGNGYTAYIIDRTTNKVVSTASVPEPTLEWKDQ